MLFIIFYYYYYDNNNDCPPDESMKGFFWSITDLFVAILALETFYDRNGDNLLMSLSDYSNSLTDAKSKPPVSLRKLLVDFIIFSSIDWFFLKP